jgi:hypothetical protein
MTFVVGIVYLLIRSLNEKIDLVTPDYYAQELQHQKIIDEKFRVSQLSAPPKINIYNQSMEITFPNELKNKVVDGSVLLYCTANSNNDFKKSFSVNNGSILISIPKKNKGLHEIKVTFTGDKKMYYWEVKKIL